MNTIYRSIFGVAILLFLGSQVLSARGSLSAGYFLPQYMYRYQLNPAFYNEGPFFSVPLVGHASVSTQGNLSFADLIYPYATPEGEELMIFMHREVPSATFLAKLQPQSQLSTITDATLLATGFRTWQGYTVLTLGLRTMSRMNLPSELFRFMKLGIDADSSYDLSRLACNARMYASIGVTHSHIITDRLTFGVTVKWLIGIVQSELDFDRFDVSQTDGVWEVDMQGKLRTSFHNNPYKVNKHGYLNGFDLNALGFSGMGVSLDFGVDYAMSDYLNLSASVLDLGFIRWSHVYDASSYDGRYQFNGFTPIGVTSNSSHLSLGDQIETLGDDLASLFILRPDVEGEKSGPMMQSLSATLLLSTSVRVPAYERLSFGILSTTYFKYPYTSHEVRLAANLEPWDCLGLSINGSYSHYGFGWGGMVNLNFPGINLFAGFDLACSSLTPQFIPIDQPRLGLTIGMNIPFY